MRETLFVSYKKRQGIPRLGICLAFIQSFLFARKSDIREDVICQELSCRIVVNTIQRVREHHARGSLAALAKIPYAGVCACIERTATVNVKHEEQF